MTNGSYVSEPALVTAFSAQSLLSEHLEMREKSMSSLFSVLIEEATLAKRMQSSPFYGEDKALADDLSRPAER